MGHLKMLAGNKRYTHEIQLSIAQTEQIAHAIKFYRNIVVLNTEVERWLYENIRGQYEWRSPMWEGDLKFVNFTFADESDALAFKLRWL